MGGVFRSVTVIMFVVCGFLQHQLLLIVFLLWWLLVGACSREGGVQAVSPGKTSRTTEIKYKLFSHLEDKGERGSLKFCSLLFFLIV